MPMKLGTIRATLIVALDGQVPRKVSINLPVTATRNGELVAGFDTENEELHLLACGTCGAQLGSTKPGKITHGRAGSHVVEYTETSG